MNTIKDYAGRTRYLSDETYIITENNKGSMGYPKGTTVRKISGVDGSEIVGYHFSRGWVTVCDITATIAEFVGVEKKYLKKL